MITDLSLQHIVNPNRTDRTEFIDWNTSFQISEHINILTIYAIIGPRCIFVHNCSSSGLETIFLVITQMK